MPDPTGPEAAERDAREKVIEAVSAVVGASQDMYCPTQEDVERADAALVTSLTAFRSAVRRAFAAEVEKLKRAHATDCPYRESERHNCLCGARMFNEGVAALARLGEGDR